MIETPHPSFLSDAQRADLRRRVAEDDASPDDTISWKQVQAESPLRSTSTVPVNGDVAQVEHV